MNTRRNLFSFIMWGLFACILSVLYYLSFHSFIDSLGMTNDTVADIITILVGVILVEIVVIIEKFIRESNNIGGDAKWKTLGIAACIAVFAALIGTRIYALTGISGEETAFIGRDISLYNRALINGDNSLFWNLDSREGIYSSLLSLFFKLLGNKLIAMYALQFILSVIAAVCIYWGVKMLLGQIEALISVLVLAVFPIYFGQVALLSLPSLDLLFLGIGLIYIAIIKKSNVDNVLLQLSIVISAVIFGLMCLYNSIYIGLLVYGLIVIAELKDRKLWLRILDCILWLVISIGAFLTPAITEELPSSISTVSAHISNLLGYRFSVTPSLEALITFARTNLLLIIVILCITYIVMFLKCRYDDAHGVIAALIITLLIMGLIGGIDQEAYSLVAILYMVMIGSAGIHKLAMAGITPYDDVADVNEDLNVTTEEIKESEELPTLDYEEPVVLSVSDIIKKPVLEDVSDEIPEKFDNVLPLPKAPNRDNFTDDYDLKDIPEELMKYDIEF